ncbi:MAG: hypothetical protein P9L93_04700 [Candidatus Gorgyraea atricola]|nr:hypothetical protein [Candidatus Gorgyraea atricola]
MNIRAKNLIFTVTILIVALFLETGICLAETVSIKGAMKIHKMGGYVILINYETRAKWTDNLLFKVHCKFQKGEFTFVSSSLNNIQYGWHKTRITIADVIKKRYGSLREYKVELYKDNVLIATKSCY